MYVTYSLSSKKNDKKYLLFKIFKYFQGGKVLIPVFALGRAQELCILLGNYILADILKDTSRFSVITANHHLRLLKMMSTHSRI